MAVNAWKSSEYVGHNEPELVVAVRNKYENLKRMIDIHPELCGRAILGVPGGGRIFVTWGTMRYIPYRSTDTQ